MGSALFLLVLEPPPHSIPRASWGQRAPRGGLVPGLGGSFPAKGSALSSRVNSEATAPELKATSLPRGHLLPGHPRSQMLWAEPTMHLLAPPDPQHQAQCRPRWMLKKDHSCHFYPPPSPPATAQSLAHGSSINVC